MVAGPDVELLRDLRRIALADPAARRAALLALLREIGHPLTLVRSKSDGYQATNIVVRFRDGVSPRIVLGAHYDSVPGSTGANDNGAGVCILLAWLRGAARQLSLPLDVVFFDLEECGQLGSRAYMASAIPEGLLLMINLDVCGVGDTLVIAPSLDVQGSPVDVPLHQANRAARCAYRLVDRLPAGDHLPFVAAGVPTIAAGMLPAEDVDPLLATLGAARRGRSPTTMPSIFETFHRGPRDTVDVVEAPAMAAVLRWLEILLAQIASVYGGWDSDKQSR